LKTIWKGEWPLRLYDYPKEEITKNFQLLKIERFTPKECFITIELQKFNTNVCDFWQPFAGFIFFPNASTIELQKFNTNVFQ